MAIGTQLLQHTVYRYRDPVWVDDIDPVWIIIEAPVWVIHIEVTVSYNDDTFGYIQIEITVSYSDSTFGYIQLFPRIRF